MRDQLRVPSHGSAVFRLAKCPIGRGRNEFSTEIVNLAKRRVVLRLSRLTVREYLRCVEEPMILLKLHQPFVFGGHTRHECVQLVGKQNRSFFCGLRSRRRFLLVVEANQPVHHRRRQRGIVRSKADLQD
jgi:hypothetical protein